jgi:hypothetical protein
MTRNYSAELSLNVNNGTRAIARQELPSCGNFCAARLRDAVFDDVTLAV